MNLIEKNALTTRTILVIINSTYTNTPRLNSEMAHFRPDTVPNYSIAIRYSCIKKTASRAERTSCNKETIFLKCKIQTITYKSYMKEERTSTQFSPLLKVPRMELLSSLLD